MYWDNIAALYDLFEDTYNRKVYRETGMAVSEEIENTDNVLECACGTGAISVYIAPKCRKLIATDMSGKMLKQTRKKTAEFSNVKVRRADMTHLKCKDEMFDKVIAGNVIHLLDDPVSAVNELVRVCKTGGKVIIPTYMNMGTGSTANKLLIKIISRMGADFKRQFDLESYKEFFRKAGYENVRFRVVEGKMPCALAVITKQ